MEFYTIKEIAAKLSLNEETIRRWIREGKLNGENIGGRTGYRISKEEYEKFLLNNKKLMGMSENTNMGLKDVNVSADNFETIKQNKYKDDDTDKFFDFLQTVKDNDPNDTKLELIKYEYKLEMKRNNILNEVSKLNNEISAIDYKLEFIKKIRKELL